MHAGSGVGHCIVCGETLRGDKKRCPRCRASLGQAESTVSVIDPPQGPEGPPTAKKPVPMQDATFEADFSGLTRWKAHLIVFVALLSVSLAVGLRHLPPRGTTPSPAQTPATTAPATGSRQMALFNAILARHLARVMDVPFQEHPPDSPAMREQLEQLKGRADDLQFHEATQAAQLEFRHAVGSRPDQPPPAP